MVTTASLELSFNSWILYKPSAKTYKKKAPFQGLYFFSFLIQSPAIAFPESVDSAWATLPS